MSKMKLFIPITKIDEDNRIVHGAAAIEKLDRVGEVFDYATSKPYFEKWSGEIEKTSGGKSKGNVRAMHGRVAAGKLTDIHFDDDGKSIDVAAKIVDEAEWQKCLEGVYTGFSLGGSYVNKWKDKTTKQTRYTADPAEISIVDFPCIPGATFEITKAAGDPETRPFKTPDAVELRARDLCKSAGSDPEDEVDHGAGIVWKWTEFVSAARDAIAAETAAPDPAAQAAAPATKVAATDPPAPETPPAAAVAVIKNETIATRASALAKAAGDETKWASFIDQAHTELKAEAGTAARPPAHKETPSDDGSESQVWLHKRLPGQTYATKAEMRDALIRLDAAEIAAAAVDPTMKALQEIRDGLAKLGPAALGPVRSTQDVASYTMLAKFMADQPGHELTKAAAAIGLPLAAEEGSSIENPGTKEKALREIVGKVATLLAPKPFDLTKAAEITDAGAFKAACASLVDQPLPETGRRALRKRARALGIAIADTPAGLMNRLEAPAGDLTKIAEGDLAKIATLSNVTTFLYLLESLERAEEALEMAPVSDPYYSPYSMMTARIEVPKDLRDRFGTLVVEMGDAVAELLDLVLAAMKEEEASEALERVAPIVDLMKAGARHSKADTTLLNGIHDASVKLGAACTTEKVQKAAPHEPADMEKVVEAQKAQFTKTISDLTTIIGDIGARLKTIEAQPAQSGAPQTLQIVDKTQDGGPLATPAGGDVDLNDPGVLKALGDLAIRAAHGRPHRVMQP